MKLNIVTKLGIALIVLIQTMQLAIAQVDLIQTNQNKVSEIVVCDEEPQIDVRVETHHEESCYQHQVIDLTHCHNNFQNVLALESFKSSIHAVELSHLHHFSELSLFYPEPALELFKPPI